MNYFKVLEDLGFEEDTQNKYMDPDDLPEELANSLEKDSDGEVRLSLHYSDLGYDFNTHTQIGVMFNNNKAYIFSSNWCVLGCCCYYHSTINLDSDFRKNMFKAIKDVEKNG